MIRNTVLFLDFSTTELLLRDKETKGMSLEDMDRLFGSEDAVRSLEDAIEDMKHGKPELTAEHVEALKA